MNNDTTNLNPYIRFRYKDPFENTLSVMVCPESQYNNVLNDIYQTNKNLIRTNLPKSYTNIIKTLDELKSKFQDINTDELILYQFEDGIELCKQAVENQYIYSTYGIDKKTHWYSNELEAIKAMNNSSVQI